MKPTYAEYQDNGRTIKVERLATNVSVYVEHGTVNDSFMFRTNYSIVGQEKMLHKVAVAIYGTFQDTDKPNCNNSTMRRLSDTLEEFI